MANIGNIATYLFTMTITLLHNSIEYLSMYIFSFVQFQDSPSKSKHASRALSNYNQKTFLHFRGRRLERSLMCILICMSVCEKWTTAVNAETFMFHWMGL